MFNSKRFLFPYFFVTNECQFEILIFIDSYEVLILPDIETWDILETLVSRWRQGCPIALKKVK